MCKAPSFTFTVPSLVRFSSWSIMLPRREMAGPHARVFFREVEHLMDAVSLP